MEDYVQRNSFTNVCRFMDDGVSGTTFDRDGFKVMTAEVEAGKVDIFQLHRLFRFYQTRGYSDCRGRSEIAKDVGGEEP